MAVVSLREENDSKSQSASEDEQEWSMAVVSPREENDSESQSTCEDEKEWSESHHGFLSYMKMESLLVEWACG